MSEVEILRVALWVMTAIATTIGSTLVALVVWAAKSVLRSMDEIRKDISIFDRRITRLESKNVWRMHARRDDAA